MSKRNRNSPARTRGRLIIVYDDWCPYCRRFVRLVKRCDTLNLVVPSALRSAKEARLPDGWDAEKAKLQMAGFDQAWNYGFDTVYKIAIRIPLFYFSVPLLLLLKITKLGEMAYNELAVKRKIVRFQCTSECGLNAPLDSGA